jgi:hypothetical protein
MHKGVCGKGRREDRPLERHDEDGSILLKWSLEKQDVG